MYDIIQRIEEGRRRVIQLDELKYNRADLQPVLSEATIDYHYGELAAGYAKRYKAKEGDDEFNYAGVFLHNIYFRQFKAPAESNTPNGPVLNLIKRKYGWWQDFKEEFKKTAMAIQGSGWVYMSYSGEIKTIVNHEVREDILFIIDWWEHSFVLDYGADKRQYLENTWKIMDWSWINTRWGKNL